ncbi:hypothetical protein HW132_10135 [Brasilonema sp. CT11]|nr:hypothetical protein [Brasilonema sp. CT11]
MNNDAENNVNIGGDVQGVSAYSISGGTFTQYFISDRETEESIHRRPLIQVSPYLGLRKFETDDKDKFFGREEWITKLSDRLLKKDNVLLLLGASGSGKSSLIRAGLIPHLRDNWGTFLNLTFRPDKNPFESFYYCLTSHLTQSQAEIARTVAENTLIQVSQSLKQDSRWLIFVDQFEELFTTTPKLERDKFVASLIQLINQQDSSVKIVFTMRADFLDKFSSYSELGHIHDRYSCILTNMSEKELQLAIAEPAARNGVTFEKGLVEQIIKDFYEQSGSLPLLEYTLDLLWSEEKKKDNLTERVLKTKTYEQLGGVSGALNQQANKIYNQELNEQEREAAKEIFLELVGIVEKQPVSRRTEKSLFLESRDKESVLNKLIQNRLLVSRGEKQIATVEVAHEQLLRSWQVLKDLIKDKEDIIVFRSRLTTDANQWNEIRKQDSQKANDELWSGSKLVQVLEYRKDPKFNQFLFAKPESLENQFIEASIARRDFLRQQEDKRKQRELETAQKVAQEAEKRGEAEAQARQAAEQRAEESEKRLKAEAEARKQSEQRRKLLTYGLVLVSALVVAAGFGLWQTEQQRKQAIDALLTSSQELFAEGKEIDARIVGINAGKQIKQAAFWINLDSQRTKAISTLLQQAVYGVREYNRLENHTDKVLSVSFSPDGKTLASASADHTIKLWDVATGKQKTTLTGHSDVVYSVSFSLDGKTLGSASADHTIKLWDVATGKQKTTLSGHSGVVYSVSFSPDGKTLASASWDKTIKLWDVATGEEQTTLKGHSDEVESVSYSPDGKTLASASADHTIKLWDVATGKQKTTLYGHSSTVFSVSYSLDGKTLASASWDKTIILWDVATGKQKTTLYGHSYSVKSVAFSPDGKTLVSASRDKTIILWDVTTGKQKTTLKGHSNFLNSVSYSPDGKTLASASNDNTIKLWHVTTDSQTTLTGHNNGVTSVSYSPDGKTLASTSSDSTIILWDVATGKQKTTLNGHSGTVFSVSYSPDGKTLASASFDNTIKLWDVATGIELTTLNGHSYSVNSVSFSPDGKTLVSASNDNTIKLWDVATGKQKTTLKGHSDTVNSVSFSPDGKTLASASWDKTVKLWDVATGEEKFTLNGYSDPVKSVAFSPDGKILASASHDKTIKLWDVTTGKEKTTLKGHSDQVYSVSFSPDGKTLASASHDKTIKLWDVATAKEKTTLMGHSDEVLSVAFSPDSKTLASASSDNTVILWDLNSILSNLDFDNLMRRDCDIIRGYLRTNSKIKDSDRTLCNGIGTQN